MSLHVHGPHGHRHSHVMRGRFFQGSGDSEFRNLQSACHVARWDGARVEIDKALVVVFVCIGQRGRMSFGLAANCLLFTEYLSTCTSTRQMVIA